MKTPKTKPLDWDAMPPGERAVAVAKDVIAQLKRKAFVATPNTYLFHDGDISHLMPEDDLRAHLAELGNCKVCAKGAIFLCSVRLFDQVTVGNNDSLYNSRVVWDLFGDDANSIEYAFEGWNDDYTPEREFYAAHPDPKRRLIAIMQNIIEHDGRFVP